MMAYKEKADRSPKSYCIFFFIIYTFFDEITESNFSTSRFTPPRKSQQLVSDERIKAKRRQALGLPPVISNRAESIAEQASREELENSSQSLVDKRVVVYKTLSPL